MSNRIKKQSLLQTTVKRRYLVSLGNLVTVSALVTPPQGKCPSYAWRSTRRTKRVRAWTILRKTLKELCSCIKLISAGVSTHMYTMLHAYFLLFTRCLQIINHQPKVPLPSSFLSSNPAIDPLVLVVPPFTGRETEAGTWQSWGQQTWTWMFQGQLKLRALMTGSGTLDLALGQREGRGHLFVSFPILLSVV